MAKKAEKIITNDGLETMNNVTNDAEEEYSAAIPYVVEVTIQGDAPLLFHRWSCDAVEAKSKAAKNSVAKKSDNIESYVYRCSNGNLGLPGEYCRMSLIGAAKYRQDPRSPRKSAMDLFKAGVISLTELADLGQNDWDYLDRRRVMVQRSGITRVRPALETGWKATFQLQVQLPEYIGKSFLRSVIQDGGRLIGLADFRPSYGRYSIVNFDELS